MVKSRIVNKTYSETEGIENLSSQIDNLIEYGYPILGKEYNYSNILLGTHILDNKTVIFPIYLLDNNHNFIKSLKEVRAPVIIVAISL